MRQDTALSAELLVFAARHRLPNLLKSCHAAVAADFMRSGGTSAGGDVGDNCLFTESATGKVVDARLCLPPEELNRLLLTVIRQARDALLRNVKRRGEMFT